MRGADTFTESPFTLHQLEDFMPPDHPLRPIRQMVNAALVKMDDLFAAMYEADSKVGRPSIAPEKLLCAMLLQVFYSIRLERQLMEQVQYNLLYRWFIGLAIEDAVWVPTVFSKNSKRLLGHDTVIELFNHVLESADEQGWLSGEHFSVDGTLIQAWASHKSFVRKDDSDGDQGGGSFNRQTRSNETHDRRRHPRGVPDQSARQKRGGRADGGFALHGPGPNASLAQAHTCPAQGARPWSNRASQAAARRGSNPNGLCSRKLLSPTRLGGCSNRPHPGRCHRRGRSQSTSHRPAMAHAGSRCGHPRGGRVLSFDGGAIFNFCGPVPVASDPAQRELAQVQRAGMHLTRLGTACGRAYGQRCGLHGSRAAQKV